MEGASRTRPCRDPDVAPPLCECWRRSMLLPGGSGEPAPWSRDSFEELSPHRKRVRVTADEVDYFPPTTGLGACYRRYA